MTSSRKPPTGRRFEKGQSGNPGGRPKTIAKVQELARERTEGAFNILVCIMEDVEQPAAARVSAANSILDRGWGKPTQPLGGDEGVTSIVVSWLPEQDA